MAMLIQLALENYLSMRDLRMGPFVVGIRDPVNMMKLVSLLTSKCVVSKKTADLQIDADSSIQIIAT